LTPTAEWAALRKEIALLNKALNADAAAKRDFIVERLAEIKADPNANLEKPSPEQSAEGEKLDSETTKLLRKLADDNPAKPSGG
jgi:hypothetical protein